MPTTPNPTPPVSDPATGAPTAPVYNTTKPDMLGTAVTSSRASIGYVAHDYDTNRYRSPYYDVPAIVSVPGTVFLDGVCPGRWSRRYYTATDAASLSGGSGYFGYDTSDQNYWWSTNFVDDGDAACSMVTSGGQYYSENTTIDSTNILMGVVTVDTTNVYLKWGSTWGLVTRNAVFDYLDSTSAYVSRSTTIPRNADGTVDVNGLNLSVMKYAPSRGCFVMFDMASNTVLYTMMDGEQKQFAGSKSGSVAPALALRTATDPNSLPLTSKMIGVPAMPLYTSPVSWGNPSATITRTITTSVGQADRNRIWLELFDGLVPSGWVQKSANQVSSQNGSNTLVSFNRGNTSSYPWCDLSATGNNDVWVADSNYVTYSAFLVSGTNTQCVGMVYPTGIGTSTQNGLIMFSAYGLTSTASPATVNGASVTQVPSPGGSAGIIAIAPKNAVAFVYDASVGAYGQVTWISQL